MLPATLSEGAVRTTRLLRDWLAEMPAWLSSALVHLSLIIILGLIQVSLLRSEHVSMMVTRNDGAGAGDFDLGTSDGGQNGESPLAGDGQMLGDPTEQNALLDHIQEVFDPGPIDPGSLNSVPKLEPSESSTKHGGKGVALGAEGKSVGWGDGSKMGLGRTSLFGIGSEGRSFVYVFDRSDSMNYQYYSEEAPNEFGNIPVRAAKAELLSSIYELNQQQQFRLIFYNHQPLLFSVYDSPGRPMYGTPEVKRRLREAISELHGEGGTNHMAALRLALNYHPDVLYLLTDGEAKDDPTPADIEELTKFNHGRTAINVIQFAQVKRPSSSLEILARLNRGQHLFIDVTKVGKLARSINGKKFEPEATTPPAE
jgi:hypothetical protein